MPKDENRNEVWWLASGQSSHSRQPSFAPATARPSVTSSYYRFGWSRSKACFVTSRRHDGLSCADIKEYPCNDQVALSMLWHCARRATLERFFNKRYSSKADRDVFVAAGYLFGVSLDGRDGEASLHFYSPTGEVQRIHLHDGMTSDFYRSVAGMTAVEIYNYLH